MSWRRSVRYVVVPVALVLASGLVAARQAPASGPAQSATLGLNEAIPVNPEITIGTLPNGLKYYVRANKQPQKRAELRLVVKAGSVLEDDDQLGLAHFVEHMAFNGTQHFPKEAVVAFLQSLGARFGADVNASTSFDETIYTLTVPTDRAEVLDQAMLILEDWAHNVSFDTAEIDKERGVIIEEWRLGRGAGMRLAEKQFPVLLKGSRYADRIPIGKTEVLQSFKPEQLKRFYSDWYRPDLMAVIAVGDFDKGATETLIKTHFASIPSPPVKRPRPSYVVPDHAGTVYSILTDKEMTGTSVEIDNLLEARQQGTFGVYREKIVDSLFSGMLSARYSEIAQKPNAPFMFASAGRGSFIGPSKDDASLGAAVKDGGIEQGLEALLVEAERVTRFGFTATELDRQKQNMLTAYQRMVTQKDVRDSSSHAAEYIRNFLRNEPLPGPEVEYALRQRFLPGIALDEINKLAKAWFTDQNRLVIVTAPDKPGVTVPDAAKLAAVMASASTRTLTAYVDSAGTGALIEAAPKGGAVAKTTAREPGITEWELSNGVKVVLKPTAFKVDEIVFRADSPGGTSLASDADYVPANTATQVIAAGGLGKYNAIDLRKMLTGKVAVVRPFINETGEGLNGSSSKKDLETMFQLIYLTFTAPRADAEAFAVQVSQTKALLANQNASPAYALAKTMAETMGQGHLRRRLSSPELVDQWNLDKSLAFYKDRFSDASDFTFVFFGDFEPAALKPLVEQYLASLPATHRKESWKDINALNPTGVIEKTVEKGIEPKSQVVIEFTGPFQWDQTQRIAIRAMAQVLQERLRESIREELGGTYSITANAGYTKIPRAEFDFGVQFGCDPQRVDGLVKRVYQEIEVLKTNGPTAQQVADVREALLREFETNSKLNSYLLGQVSLKYQQGEDPATLWLIPDYYRKLDTAGIQQAAKTYLSGANRVQVTLMPEKK